MRTHRVGVIGLGGNGWGHAESYRKQGCELVAVADVREERLAEAREKLRPAKVFSDYRQLLALPEIEAVTISLPNYLHAPVAIDALRAGKHVLIEKPMAMNAAEAEEMIAAARASGVKLMVGLNNRFRRDVEFLRARVAAGELGEVYYGHAGWLRRMNYARGWFREKEKSGGGPLIDLGVHMLDLVLYLMGSPRATAVSASTFTKLGDYDVEDFACAFIRLEGGKVVNLEVSWEANIPHFDENERNFVRLYGTRGGADLSPLVIHTRVDGREVKVVPSVSPDEGGMDSRDREIEHFLTCIEDDTEPSPSGEEALNVMKILDAIYRSAGEGREVRVT